MSDSEQNSAISNLLGGIGEFLEVIVSFLGGIVVYSVLILLGLWIFGDSDGVETDSEVIAAFHANANASCHGAKAYEGFYDSPYLNLKEASGEWTIEEMPQPCLDSALLTACITGIKEHCPPDLDPHWYAKYTAPIFDRIDNQWSKISSKKENKRDRKHMQEELDLLKQQRDELLEGVEYQEGDIVENADGDRLVLRDGQWEAE